MSEKGGRYFREARFFFLGDKPLAQSHVPEARALLGYLRDMHAMGGPPIQVKYATLQDGTKIKAVMMNGQYQAVIESGTDEGGDKCPILRFIQVVTDADVGSGGQIGKPFTLAGFPHGVIDGPHPQILFGSDIPGYRDYDAFKDEYGLASVDVLAPIGTPDEFAVGEGNAFWVDENDKDGGVLSWGRPLGAPASNTDQGVYWQGKTVALPCTSNQTVVGAALLSHETGLNLVVITSEISTPTTSSIIRVKYAPFTKNSVGVTAGSFTEAGNTTLTVSGYTNIGNPAGQGATAWNARVTLYKFSKDATRAAGVITGRGVSTIVLTRSGGAITCGFNQIKDIAAYSQVDSGGGCNGGTTGGVGSCKTDDAWVSGAAYTPTNLLQILWYQRSADSQNTDTGTTTQVVTGDSRTTTSFYLRDDGADRKVGGAVETLKEVDTRIHPMSGGGGVCLNHTSSVKDEERTWEVDRCPVAYALDHRFFISSSVSAISTTHTETSQEVDSSCDVVPGTGTGTTNHESTFSIGLVRHAAERKDAPISQYEGSGNVRITGIATAPPSDVRSIVYDSNNYIVMIRLADGLDALPVAPFSAPAASIGTQHGFSVGVWADCGKHKHIPFIGNFFDDDLAVSASFGLVSAKKAERQ